MKKVFIDANIFFAASYSKNGGSALILELAKKKKIKIITVSYALAEAEKNIELKLGQKYLSIHHQNHHHQGVYLRWLLLLEKHLHRVPKP